MNDILPQDIATSSTTFDRTTIRNHFWMLHHLAERANVPGKLVLSAIAADKSLGLPPINRHFQIGDIDGMTAGAMAFEGLPYGIYESYAVMRPDLPDGAKGGQDDVVATLAFPVDADADHPGVAPPHAPVAPNLVIESSEGNFQEIMILDRALSPDESKPLAKALGELTGDKMCVADISRIMRVPGTLNWPNAAKIKRGRSPNPQPVRVKQAWDSWTVVDNLRAVVAANVKPKTAPKITAPVPDAFDGVSHDGIRYAEVVWYCQHMAKVWTLDDRETTPDDFELAKRIKLSFPGEDGLNAVLLLEWGNREEEIRKRWWKPNDFKTEGENLLTLLGLKEVNWMFRYAFGCPMPPPGPAIEIPAEILVQMNAAREQYLAGAIGPLPDHPELPIDQANALTNFWAHLPSGKIIHEPSRGLWASGSFDKHCGRVKDAMQASGPGMLASTWLSQHRAVQSMGWDPGEPMIIEDRILADDWVRAPGCRSFNLYLPSSINPVEGDVSKWLDHIKFIYPGEWAHIVLWFAHRMQRPGEKVNHGLVFIGQPGVGKDTAIEPVVAAVGSHNFKSISAKTFFTSDFNGYLKSVMLRIDEVHDLGGESKYAFHDRTKPILAAPPAAHYVNEKNVPHHAARNVCGVILTSNHADALYLDRNDRRHFVCISDRKKEDFPDGYFDGIYAWFENGGNEAVAHYLANLDLTGFNAKTPPPKTAGWHMVVAAGLAPESGDLTDVIETMGKPAALTLPMVRARMPRDSHLHLVFDDPKLRRALPKRLAECGYIAVANPDARDSGGRWRMNGGKTTIYARQDLSESERLAAARLLSTPALVAPPPY